MASPAPWQDVPAELGVELRAGVPAAVAEIIAAVRAEVPEYDLPFEGAFGRFISRGVEAALNEFLALLGTEQAYPSTAIPQALGRAELDAGRTLDALQSAYRVGARVAWRSVVAQVGDRLDPQVMYRLAEAIFAYIDQLADASVAGYSEALALREGSAQTRRQALVEALLAGTPVDDLARRAGWAVPRTVAVLATDDEDPVALARRLPDGTLAARTDDGACLVVPDPDGPGRRRALQDALAGVRCAVGPTRPLAEAPASASRAARGLALAQDGPLWTDEHRLALLLAADPELAAELRAAHLGPLDALTEKARARAEQTLRAWLDAHGDVSVAAEALVVHPQTVRYRLGTLRELLGDAALDDPRLRLELALALT